MKKLTIIAALFISFVNIGKAQSSSDDTDNREKFQIGFKAGLNYANVYDENDDDFKADAKFGIAAGAIMAIPFNKYLGLQPEVLISQKGFKASGMMYGNPYSFTRTTTYLDIPLQFVLKPSEFITILVGPQYSYLLNKRDVFKSTANSYEQEQQFQNDNIRKNVLGIVGGIDLNLKHIILGARIGADLQNNAGDGSSSTPRYKNMWFQGTIGYNFYK